MTNVKIVIGASYGDEGKGLMTDYFCNKARERGENCLVVLSNGGAQRGHTVDTPDGKYHVFHHFGSGTFVGADTYFPEKFIVNPMMFIQEWVELYDKAKEMSNIWINENCLCTTPFDMIINQIVEEYRGENKHGSCGCGIWETIERNGLRFGQMCDLLQRGRISSYLENVRDIYLRIRVKDLEINRIPDKWKEILNNKSLIDSYISDLSNMMKLVHFTDDTVLKGYKNIVFENGQGLLLDFDEHPVYSTPSKTGIHNPKEIIERVYGVNIPDVEVCYVSRSYLTRHGAGPFKEECDKSEISANLKDETNVFNIHQGELRYGRLNLGELRNRVISDFKTLGYGRMSIAFTHMNYAPEDWKTTKYDHIFCDDSYECYFSNGKTRISVI